MFIYSIILAVILGFVFKGSLKNLSNINMPGTGFVIAGFAIDAATHLMSEHGVLKTGIVTYLLGILMYIFIFVFVYLNRKNPYIIVIGIGFLLNAAAIFSNGGVMPVAHSAMASVSITQNPSSIGLYSLVDSSTKLKFLCDVIPVKFLANAVVSIGDIIAAIGIMLFIITGMCSKNQQEEQKAETV